MQLRPSRFGLGANAFDHRAQPVRALRCEIPPQADAVKQRQGIDRQNVSRVFARVERKRIAIKPRTMCASLSPWNVRIGPEAPFGLHLDSQTRLAQP